MAEFKVKITADRTEEVIKKLEQEKEKILEACGQTAVTHAKNIITRQGRVDTGAMRNSITHQVDLPESKVCIGTNNEYAIYNEYGTGIYAEDGNGRKTPWFYVDSHGEGHYTHGMKPIHMLKNSLTNFQSDYRKIIQDGLSKVEE